MSLYKRSRRLFVSLIVLMTLAFLSACDSILPVKNGQEDGMKVLIVEFGSRAPIPDMKVTVRDVATNEEVDTASASFEGEAVVKNLQVGHQYLFVPSSIYDDENKQNGIGKVVTITSDTTYIVLETYYKRDNQQLQVPVILQNPELPHGCEITAMTAVLNYYGLNLSKMKMAKKYLPTEQIVEKNNKAIGPDPNKAYAGDPANKETGTYVFAPVITKAAKQVAADNNVDLQVTNLTGANQKELVSLVQKGVPVITWVTLDLSKPKMKEGWWIEGTRKQLDMYLNLHVVVLTGIENDKVIVMDPLQGYVSHDIDEFFKSYKQLGSQAVAIQR